MEPKTDPTPPKKKAPNLAELGDGIPIKQIVLAREYANVNWPHGTFGLSLMRAGKGDGGTYVLSWFPQVRAIRVEFRPQSSDKETSMFFVHESWCTWEV